MTKSRSVWWTRTKWSASFSPSACSRSAARWSGYETLTAFSDEADPAKPGVVVFGPTTAPDDVISQVSGLIGFRPGCGAVMVVYELTAEVLQGALRAGVDDVVAVTAEDSELLDVRVACGGPGQGAPAGDDGAPPSARPC